jgi:hypothetical protein
VDAVSPNVAGHAPAPGRRGVTTTATLGRGSGLMPAKGHWRAVPEGAHSFPSTTTPCLSADVAACYCGGARGRRASDGWASPR